MVLLALGTLPPVLWLYRIFGTQIPWRPGETVSLSASLLISSIALWSVMLIRRGRFQWAIRQLMLLVAVILVVSYALTGLGAHVFEMPVQVLWLFVAGMMIGRKALWSMYGALVLALMLGAGADVRNEAMAPGHAFGDAVIRSVMFLLIALVIDRSVAALRESLKDAMARSAELEQANAQLLEEINAREQAQAQVLHAQKMEAVGRMASGLAHDFGHLLTLVDGYAANAVKATSEDERTAALEGVRSAAARADAQVGRLLHFARRDPGLAEGFDAAATIRDIAPMLRQTLGAANRLELGLPEPPVPIRLDREQFALVLLNLAANAADAMPEGGRFVLAARVVDGTTLEIAAGDDGGGVPEPLRERVFEPFFTTKPPDHGTGLGLAVARDLVEAAGGSLTLDPGGSASGAMFRIRLPLDVQASLGP
ncbi:sensor histidine kinase [Luteimonas aestuarii]|uniref:sensor histidine kinase n=1 Tax=Luteimonas aestuarii TaxID=453837 RepID=UPI0014050293|nr:ATP-binding protein [Luteimonas aestuarii]